MKKFGKSKLAALILAAFGSANAAAATISFDYIAAEFDGVAGQKALLGFQEAADFWTSIVTDDVNLNINIGYRQLDQGVIGQAGSTSSIFLYEDVANAMINDATSVADLTAVSNLNCDDQNVGVCAIRFLDSEETGIEELDADGSPDNFALSINQANAKALGFTEDLNGAFSEYDAEITFSTAFNFDFNADDGISAGTMDFVGVAIHEIGHALGFVSGVDIYDIAYNALNPAVDVDGFAMASTLDLFRCSADSLAAGEGVLDFRPGAEAYFSIDGCQTNLGLFSTGPYAGDGQQASHWKDHMGLGIFDPTVSFGESPEVTALDLLAIDVIGWDLNFGPVSVPSPAGLVLFTIAGAGLLAGRRKRKLS